MSDETTSPDDVTSASSDADSSEDPQSSKSETKATTDDVEAKKPEGEDATDDSDTDRDADAKAAGEGDDDKDDASGEPGAEKAGADDAETRKRRKRASAKDRVRKALDRAKAAEARADSAESRLAELGELKPPKREDFEDPDDFDRAVTRHAVKEARQEDRASEAKVARKEADAEKVEAFYERVDYERMPDFDDVFAENASLPVNGAMRECIVESEKGPELAYWLGKNPKEARRISRLPPIRAAKELGAIEGRLSQTRRRTKSQAPAPLKTVDGGSGKASKSLYGDDISYEEYRKRRGFSETVRS